MGQVSLFTGPRPVLIGVVHLLATPGAPGFGGSMAALLERAEADARAWRAGGADALLVENFGDTPFFAGAVPSETVAALALALARVRAVAGELPLGVNVLRNDARAALGLCATAGASFLRVNVHAGAMWTDQGLVEGRAAETLRERARLCPAAELLADVHVKHARAVAGESLEEAARDTFLRARADCLVVSGTRTGEAPAAERLARVHAAVPTAPLLIGSGCDEHNARELLAHARGALVGTAAKRGGRVEEPVDAERVARLRHAFDAAHSSSPSLSPPA
jgi:hypothetical protein